MEQVGKFVFLERLQLLDKLLDLLIAIVGMGNVLDFLDIPRHPVLAGPPVAGFAVVVGDEERGVAVEGVGFALGIVGRLDRDIVGLALDHDQRGLAVGLVLGRAPNNHVGPRRAEPRPATCNSSSIWSRSKPYSLWSVTT